ncbi:MAG: DegT/DnrJ/EryC1/StrS family aminotransferase [Nanoarchaeota archaeon]|nr:DegT/DnrJ/EryC1/StrS family aminotransferase [DPANN group archaeon]MBL7116670.1 DegT/DnrJ/EryC1/StrS family aminotransferase [Nanoarchaeota archaeon]
MIPLAKPYIDKKDIKEVERVLKSGRLSLGPKINEFERFFAKIIGTKYAVAVNSGTSGLHLCVRSLGIKEGDEVITSPFSFVASANCMLFEKAKPIFADVDEDTFNLNPNLIEDKITSRTKAILPVHVFGQSCDMSKIINIAKKHNLKVIEDACESLNSTYKNKKVGTFGDAAVFAFYPNKQITTGEGGMIVTNNKKTAEACRSMRNQGRGESMQWLTHEQLGYNYRITDMQAALGISQLKKIDFLINQRRKVVAMYMNELSEIPQVKSPVVDKFNTHTWFVFPIQVSEKDRDRLIEHLLKEGIQSKAYFYPPIHLQPFYKKSFGYRKGDFPVAEKISKTTLILPMFVGMTRKEVINVKNSIIKFYC